jgi:hypothetical protein
MSKVIEEALRMRLAQIDQELIGKPGTVNMGLNDFLKNAMKAADDANAALARYKRLVDNLLNEKKEIESWLLTNTGNTYVMSDEEKAEWTKAADFANEIGAV